MAGWAEGRSSFSAVNSGEQRRKMTKTTLSLEATREKETSKTKYVM
jgi:hypothetical protein